jgi:hypothetical protein
MFEIGADRASPLAAFAALAAFCARAVGAARRAATSEAALMLGEGRRIELGEKGYVSRGPRGAAGPRSTERKMADSIMET